MRSIRNLILKKLLHSRVLAAVVLCAGVVIFAAAPLAAHASLSDALSAGLCATNPAFCAAASAAGSTVSSAVTNISGWVIAKMAYVISYIFTLVFAGFISLEAWLLEVILGMSTGIVNSTPVRVGFPIVLAIANLAFVAGIIFIAIATILRQQKYGVKKILWRLVVMAVLVNFGLVICGSVLAVTDNMTTYLINSIKPPDSDGTSAGYFAKSLAGAFNPQKGVLGVNIKDSDPSASADALSKIGDERANIGQAIAPMIGVLGALGTNVMIFITFAVLILMLLYRYIRLGLLLITLPIAWTAWVFPAYEKVFKRWLERFTQYAFFAPAVMFFMWLALQVSKQLGAQAAEFAKFTSDSSNPLIASISTYFGNIVTPVVQNFLQVIILFGIMLGGMTAAQELGVKFGAEGVKALEGAGKGARQWAMRKTKATGSRIKQRGQVKEGVATSRLGRLALNMGVLGRRLTGQSVQTKPVTNAAGDVIGKQFEVTGKNAIGRGVEKVTGGAKKVQRMAQWLDPEYMGQKLGETDQDWQARLAQMDPHLKPKIETDKEGIERLEKLFDKDRVLRSTLEFQTPKTPGESDEDWFKRLLDTSNDARIIRGGETIKEWGKRVKEIKDKKDQKQPTLLGSLWGGASKPFSHKAPTQENVMKALEASGLHIQHEEHPPAAAHPEPAPAAGGDAPHPPGH